MTPAARRFLTRQDWRPGAGGAADAGWRQARLWQATGVKPAGDAVAPRAAPGSHPFADAAVSEALRRRAAAITEAFARIESTLEDLAVRQFEPGGADRARLTLRDRLGVDLEPEALHADWKRPLDIPRLQARCVIATFLDLVDRGFDRGGVDLSDGEPAAALIRRWGFHAIDIAFCSDGRLSGLLDFILRVPPTIVEHRSSHPGAMFAIEPAVRQWEEVELRRSRRGSPNAADAGTRYLKIGVYHYSSVDPDHEGCAAHGSSAQTAAHALLERLIGFRKAIANKHGCPGEVPILLVGVDTDSDAIRLHVPNAEGRVDVGRFIDNSRQYEETHRLPREAAKDCIRDAVAAAAGVAPTDAASEGMRWLCGYLLKNNLAQVDAVRSAFGGPYPDRGHGERLIVVGDGVDQVQLRNLAFQAHMQTFEEGAADLDVGIRVVGHHYRQTRLAIPVLVHCRFDPRIPGAEQEARRRADRIVAAVTRRYADQVAAGSLFVGSALRAADPGGAAAGSRPVICPGATP